MKKNFRTVFQICFILSTLHIPSAFASLGGDAASIEDDRKALNAEQPKIKSENHYSIYEFTNPTVTVREYLSASGKVFGIAWSGLNHPNLNQLLGIYKTNYQDDAKKTPRKPGGRTRALQSGGAIIKKWGHARKVQGRIYDPALLPAGVKVNEIN